MDGAIPADAPIGAPCPSGTKLAVAARMEPFVALSTRDHPR